MHTCLTELSTRFCHSGAEALLHPFPRHRHRTGRSPRTCASISGQDRCPHSSLVLSLTIKNPGTRHTRKCQKSPLPLLWCQWGICHPRPVSMEPTGELRHNRMVQGASPCSLGGVSRARGQGDRHPPRVMQQWSPHFRQDGVGGLSAEQNRLPIQPLCHVLIGRLLAHEDKLRARAP